MKKANLAFALACLLALTAAGTASAATGDEDVRFNHRLTGDRTMNLTLGPILPLFFQDFGGTVLATNLSPGGLLGLDIDFYLTNTFKLGGGIRGAMTFGPNGHSMIMVPITVNTTYEFKFWPFTVPVSLATGISFDSYNNALNLDLAVIPGTGLFWNYDGTWAFGANARYWWIPQIYYGAPWGSSHNLYGNFLELSLSATYHFL